MDRRFIGKFLKFNFNVKTRVLVNVKKLEDILNIFSNNFNDFTVLLFSMHTTAG